MSGEKRAVADPSWEFTVGLVRGILIGNGIVRGRSCVGGRQAACWERRRDLGVGGGRGGGGSRAGAAGVGTGFFFFVGMLLLLRCCDSSTHMSQSKTGSP